MHSDLDSGLYSRLYKGHGRNRGVSNDVAGPQWSSFFFLILPLASNLVKEGRVRHGLTHPVCRRRLFPGQEDLIRHILARGSLFLSPLLKGQSLHEGLLCQGRNLFGLSCVCLADK